MQGVSYKSMILGYFHSSMGKFQEPGLLWAVVAYDFGLLGKYDLSVLSSRAPKGLFKAYVDL